MPKNKYIYHLNTNSTTGGENTESLEKYKTYLGVNYRKKNSYQFYYNTAKRFHTHAKGIYTEETITQYIIHLNQTQKIKSIRDNIYGMNRYLHYLKLDRYKKRMPPDKRITRPIITREQIIQIIEETKNNYPYMDYLILLFIRDCDCRIHEMTRMKWSWIDENQIYFHDCKTGDTIGNISPELKTALQHWRSIHPYPNSDYVFVNQQGRNKGHQMSDKGNYMNSLFHKISEKMKRHINSQTFRSSVMSAEFLARIDPNIIQYKARHRNIKTTLQYNHNGLSETQQYVMNGTIFNGYKNSFISTCRTPSTIKPYMEIDQDASRYSWSFSFSFYNNNRSICFCGWDYPDELLYMPPQPLFLNTRHQDFQPPFSPTTRGEYFL